jgi:hypothetical protein
MVSTVWWIDGLRSDEKFAEFDFNMIAPLNNAVNFCKPKQQTLGKGCDMDSRM